jgi:uncharacterized protein (TIGR02145 family)
MKKTKKIITITGVLMLLFSYGNISWNIDNSGGSNSNQQDTKSIQTKTKSTQTVSKPVQTKTKSTQTSSKSVQAKTKSSQPVSKSSKTKTKPVQKSIVSVPENKIKEPGTVAIGTHIWAVVNLNVNTFRNGDTIPEAKTNKEWVEAGASGKPAWCYYNNDPAIGLKYGKLYNWYALNDPRGLAPAGWTLPGDADWATLVNNLGGQGAAGSKMKSNGRWNGGNNGTDESGFTGFPGGYRVENGTFVNIGDIGIWWSSEENNPLSAIDHYLSQSNSLGRSSSPKQRGESVRCLRK